MASRSQLSLHDHGTGFDRVQGIELRAEPSAPRTAADQAIQRALPTTPRFLPTGSTFTAPSFDRGLDRVHPLARADFSRYTGDSTTPQHVEQRADRCLEVDGQNRNGALVGKAKPLPGAPRQCRSSARRRHRHPGARAHQAARPNSQPESTVRCARPEAPRKAPPPPASLATTTTHAPPSDPSPRSLLPWDRRTRLRLDRNWTVRSRSSCRIP